VLAPPSGALPPPALALTLSAPIGVVAGILPFNFPLCGAVAKLAPALAAGCCIVLKPSEQCPLSPLHLAALCAEAGLPPGVVGVVPGGKDTGAHLVAHALVRKVSFTGSTAVGKAIARVCSDRLARTTLELGGKNALVIAPDYEDMEEAARVACGANYFNAGQICAWGRSACAQPPRLPTPHTAPSPSPFFSPRRRGHVPRLCARQQARRLCGCGSAAGARARDWRAV
jgi:acyl-CoA reductase-like NAD-dependent aldehyde dehydrogenase